MTLSSQSFQRILLRWFDQHGRHTLPWQINKTPYRVWVSEIMLQQTQVKTVIPYYQHFMKSFPTLSSLCAGACYVRGQVAALRTNIEHKSAT